MNNKLEVIGIDHGWSMMKTVTQVFVTGVKEITTTPALFGDVLEYEQSFNKPEEVAAVMGDCMCQFDREVVCVVNLSSDLKPINVHFASVGSLNEAMAHPRELFKASILSNAASMMLIHCHPSGNIFPSKADTMMTDRMNKLCELIGIPLLDHIIVGGDNRAFFSFKEKGMIDNPRITLSTDYRNLDIKSPLVAEQGKAR